LTLTASWSRWMRSDVFHPGRVMPGVACRH
jgi:hypothetical protein